MEETAFAETDDFSACTGHMDLSVVIRVAGLTEAGGLYALDETGNASGSSEEAWPGWNDETKAYVTSLEEKDWMVWKWKVRFGEIL